MTEPLINLFADPELADITRLRRDEPGNPDSALLFSEGSTCADAIGVQVEIPWERLSAYGTAEPQR
jgi:hypothetical protein